MGFLSNLGAKAKRVVTQIFNPGKSSTSTASRVNAGVPLTQATKVTQRKTFSDLVRSTPAATSSAARISNIAVGMPVTSKPSSSKIQESKITQGRAKKSDIVRAQPPTIPVGQGLTSSPGNIGVSGSDVLTGVGLGAAGLAVAGADTTTGTGGENMGWYNSLDENLGGLLPGGEKVDWGQAATMAAVLAGGYGIKAALSAGTGVNTLQRLFGGGRANRKVYRRRIGVKRSDIKRLKAMSRDLHRLDKVVNAAHIADIRFSRTTKAR